MPCYHPYDMLSSICHVAIHMTCCHPHDMLSSPASMTSRRPTSPHMRSTAGGTSRCVTCARSRCAGWSCRSTRSRNTRRWHSMSSLVSNNTIIPILVRELDGFWGELATFIQRFRFGWVIVFTFISG